MAVVSLQGSNVFSYSFVGQGNSHFNYIVAGNNNPILNIGGESWTIECWIKTHGIFSNYQSIFSKRLGATTTSSYQGTISATNGYIGYYNGTNYTGLSVTPNVWHHVAWVFNQGANLRIFINGSNTVTTTAVTSTVNNEARLHLGFNPGENSQFFGEISNFRIIKGQALYSGDFKISNFPVQLPNNAIGSHAGTTNVASTLTGNVIFLTCNDQIIKSNGNTTINGLSSHAMVYPHVVEPTETQNFSYYFPETKNSSVLITSTSNLINLNTDFTIEMWYYPTSNSGVLLERGIGGVGNNSASYILLWDSPNNNINFAVANANNVGYSVGALTGAAGSLGTVTINTWNHIAVTRAGTSYRGFLNGNLNFNVVNGNTPYSAIGRGITIGGRFDNGAAYPAGVPSNTISGYISNLRIIRNSSIYNAAFTPQQSQSLLTVPPVGGLSGTILLTALTPRIEDLSLNHTLTSNGMSGITFSPASPFTSNAVSNANGSSPILVNSASGGRLSRIYNKFDYQNFGQVIEISQAVGQDQGRIIDKIEAAEFAMSVPVYNTIGQDQGRIYDKIESAEFAYIPVGGAGGGVTGNIEYQFWS